MIMKLKHGEVVIELYKEIAKLNGKIDKFVTRSTKKVLKDKYV